MIDKLEEFRRFLLEPSALVTALGGDYVTANRLPAGYDNTHAAILLQQETGGAHVSGSEVSDVVICTCYGGSALDSDARAIFRALYDRCLLPAMEGEIKTVFYLNDLALPNDPDTGWPSHIGRFAVYMEN